MKFRNLVWVLYPAFLVGWAAHSRPWLRSVIMTTLLAAFIVPTLIATLRVNYSQQSGWTAQWGQVLSSGTVITDRYGSFPYAVIQYGYHGQLRTTTAEPAIRWGNQVRVWTKGNMVAAERNPTDRMTNLLWFNLVVVTPWWIVAFHLNRFLKEGKTFQLWDNRFSLRASRVRGQRIERRNAGRAAPANLGELRSLIAANPRLRVRVGFAERNIAHCYGGVQRFRDAHFPGRRWVELRELEPYLGKTHPERNEVCRVIIARLKTAGVIQSTFDGLYLHEVTIY